MWTTSESESAADTRGYEEALQGQCTCTVHYTCAEGVMVCVFASVSVRVVMAPIGIGGVRVHRRPERSVRRGAARRLCERQG